MVGSFVEELRDTIRNAYCTLTGTYANFLEQYFPSFGPFGPNPGLSAARFAHRLFCNAEPPPPPPAPFTGGQCPGVSYRVYWTISIGVGSTPWATYPRSGNNVLPGPITGIVWEYTNTSGGKYEAWLYYSGGSARVLLGFLTNINSNGAAPQQSDITSIVRVDGLPDNCGDPEPEVPPPADNYNVSNTNITYIDVGGNNVTVPISLVFAPALVNVSGEILIPVRVNVPIDVDLDINGTVNLNTGDINLNFGDQNNLPGADGCKPPSPGLPDDVPEPPTDIPDYSEPDNPGTVPTVIRGCIVTVTDVGNNLTHVLQTGNPDVYLPRLGNVQFQIEVDRNIAWTEDFPVKNRRQFIPCPWSRGAIAVEGTPSPGVSWEITPVYDFSDALIDIVPFIN